MHATESDIPVGPLWNVFLRYRNIRRQAEWIRRNTLGRSVDIPDAVAIDGDVVVIVGVIVTRHRNVAVLSPMNAAVLVIAAEVEIPIALGRSKHGDVVVVVSVIVRRGWNVGIYSKRLAIEPTI